MNYPTNDRTKSIGGSDAAAVLGFSKYKTPVDVWMEKTGRTKDEDLFIGNRFTHWGNRLEDVVLNECEAVIGKRIIRHPPLATHSRFHHMTANLDGVIDGDGEGIIIEAKTSSRENGWGEDGGRELPMQYYVQCQHNMEVAGAGSAIVPVLIGGNDFRIIHVDRSDRFAEAMLKAEARFWDHVKNDTPPEPMIPADFQKIMATMNDKSVEASAEVRRGAASLKDVVQQIAELHDEEDRLKALIKMYMRDAGQLTIDGTVFATWKESAPVRRIDIEWLKLYRPDAYHEALRERKGSRRFLLKGGKG